MSTETDQSDIDDRNAAVLEARASIPGHVVYRDFVNETVMLNLETGTYHGLNRTAGFMLAELGSAPSVRDAAERVAAENGWDPITVVRDIVELCRSLLETGLIELHAPDADER